MLTTFGSNYPRGHWFTLNPYFRTVHTLFPQDLRQLLLELVLHLPAQLPDLIGLMPKLMKLVVQALQVGGGGVRPLRGSGKDMVGPCFGSSHFLHFHPPRSFTLV